MKALLPFTVLFLVGCPSSKTPNSATNADAPPVDEQFSQAMLAAMDPTVSACDDFYRYACGGWLDGTELPADKANYVRSFSTITDRNETMVKELLQSAASDPGDGADQADRKKLGDFYAACLDDKAVEAQGISPLQPVFERIDALRDHDAAFEEAGRLSLEGYDPLFSGFVTADAKDPETNVLYLLQGGLGLPDRTYYFDEPKKPLLEGYRQLIEAQFVNAGDSQPDAAARAERIVAFEVELARSHWPRQELRDPERTHNRVDRAGLPELAPGLPWEAMLNASGAGHVQGINVMTPSVFEALPDTFQAASLETVRDYLKWRVLDSDAAELSSAFVDANFNFYGKQLSGQKEQRPRWKRCVSRVNRHLGHLVGKVYVADAFAGESKDTALNMIKGIGDAFEAGLPALTWMDEATKAQAITKARAVTPKIGYPDEGAWREYPFEVKRGDHHGNVVRSRTHFTKWNLGKVDKPVDKREWFMNPHMVNAYYNPSANEIAFPAGILQPPFFDASWPKAANYGAIGMVMGHELTHGFDDQGRKFDASGQLSDWWDEAAVSRFEERAKCVSDVYSTYEIDGTNVNGVLTNGENIADIGGTRVAYRAYRAWSQENGMERGVGDLSSDQVFFVAMGQAWCSLSTPERLQVRLATDPHSPPRFRVNGVVAQLPEFAAAFDCPVGAPMRPAEVCEVW